MITKANIEARNASIRAAIERKRNILSSNPGNDKLAARLAFDERMLAAGERLAKIAMPSGVPATVFLTSDEQEYLSLIQ